MSKRGVRIAVWLSMCLLLVSIVFRIALLIDDERQLIFTGVPVIFIFAILSFTYSYYRFKAHQAGKKRRRCESSESFPRNTGEQDGHST